MAIKLSTQQTFTYEDGIIVVDDYGHFEVQVSANVGDLRPYGDGSDTVSLNLSKRKVYADGSTDFSNESTTVFVTVEQALAFAHAIIKQLA